MYYRMRTKYILLHILNFVVGFKFNIPDGKRLTHKLKKLKIKNEISKRHTPPAKLDDDTLTNLESIGFFYDENDTKWKRNTRNEITPITYGKSPDVDKHTMQLWKDNVASEFANETFLFKLPKTKKKFNPKLLNETVSYNLQQNTQIQRLGFMFKNGKWVRGIPRNTPRIVEIRSKDRIMSISVIDEFDERIINRLDYIISKSLHTTSMSVFDGAFRIGLQETTLFIWVGAQYKLWELFKKNPIILEDAWSNKLDLQMPEMSAMLWGSAFVFLISSYYKNLIWDETSGSLFGGSLEHSIVDGILSNYTKAPASYMDRKQMGVNHVILSTFLRMISSFPKVAFVQFYLQNKIYYFILNLQSLDRSLYSSLDSSFSIFLIKQNNLEVILETAVILGCMSVIVEVLSFIWIRPPKTSYDEIHAIKESILSDDIHVRILKSNFLEMKKNKNCDVLTKVNEKKIKDTEKEIQKFKNLSNAWLIAFHNTDVHTILRENNSKEFRNPLFLLSNFMTSFSVSLSYSLSDNLLFPIALNIIGNFFEEIPTLQLSKHKITNFTLSKHKNDSLFL